MIKYKLFIGIVLAFLFTLVKAQRNEIDSLKVVLNTLDKDTARVNALLDLSSRIFRFQPDEAIRYSQEAVQLSEELHFQEGKAYGLKNVGLAYFIKGNYTEVKNYWEQSLSIFQSMEDQLGISNLLNNLGAVYFNQGDDPRALEYYLESLRVSEKIGDKLRIATALTNIGAVYFNNPVNHDKAREYYSRALVISEESGDPDAIATSSVNLGEIYIEHEELDSALFYFQKALKVYEATGGNAAYTLNNISKVHAARGDFREALKFQTRAYEESLELDAKLEMIQSLNGLGKSHLELARRGDTLGDLNMAQSYFAQAYSKAVEADISPEIRDASKGLYETYKTLEDFPEALKYHEAYEAIKDTLLNEEKIKQLTLFGAEYEFRKEKDDLDAKIKRQRLIQYATAGGLFIALVLIGVIVQYYRLRRIRIAERFETQRQLIMQEKMASLGQITAGIAHEIKNPLNFVTNFAEGSIDLGDELLEVLDQNQKKIPEDQYNLLQELAADIQQNAKDIQENGLRADRVIRSMMEQARGDKGDPKKLDLNTLIDENIHLAYHGYRGHVPNFALIIEKNYDPNLPLVEVIPQDLGRVILNIFNNAFYALTQKQNELGESFTPTIQVSTQTSNGQALIRLRDNGPGIPENIRDKIFQPFFTTKPTSKGNSGLGLSISHDLIVIGHKGAMEVQSEVGEYTEFLIRLPIERGGNSKAG